MYSQKPGDHHFFARKFEAIVNQEIVGLLDTHLYGEHPENTPALKSYWENVYHVDDDITKPSNGRYSTYQSFLRQGLKLLYDEEAEKGSEGVDCGIPKQAVVKEVTVLQQADQFNGLVITLRDELSGSLTPPEFELFYSITSYVKRYSFDGDLAKRIYALEVRDSDNVKCANHFCCIVVHVPVHVLYVMVLLCSRNGIQCASLEGAMKLKFVPFCSS